MKTAVISFTQSGRCLSERIAAALRAKRFCFHKYSDGSAESFTELPALMAKIAGRYDALVFVSSVGIAVRAFAPYIRSKLTDPAIVAADDGGQFAVSVLSGHLGGANELTRLVAAAVGAVPVVTTSTDVHGKFSPDVFAKKNGLFICDIGAAKAVAAAVLNGDRVGFRCEYPHSPPPPELTECESGDIGISVSDNADEKPFAVTLNLLPKDLIVGVGCKKGTEREKIAAHITRVLGENGLDPRRILAAATICLKADEPGLKEFCERLSLPLRAFTAAELMSAEGEFAHSDFVEQTTGADNICERAAVCAGGKIIVRKTAENGVTCAVGKLPVTVVFERNDA